MKHPYKAELLVNLKMHYGEQSYRAITFFDGRRDEILFVLPTKEDISTHYETLPDVLSGLPEINHPRERTVISFCDENGDAYCSRLINPNKQDEINLALIGYRPQRKVRPEELQELT
ncbi:hypothetical protein [Pedobacter nyackensis]|uniref:hypothetical protein n=1 Tax=Pedobacter nyackensis TaxID=475255 RepID=UPI00292FE9B0|nr:hypothetical protein [Pedobacter nyackensis]